MKTIKEYINESLTKYNKNTLFYYVLSNVDYRIVNEILNENFDDVKIPTDYHRTSLFDFAFREDNNLYSGLIYKPIFRKESSISFEPNSLGKNNKLKIAKKMTYFKNYISYIYNDSLCLVKLEQLEEKINNYNCKLDNLEPEYSFKLNDKQKNYYNEIYSIYDKLSPESKNQNINEFEDLIEIINKYK